MDNICSSEDETAQIARGLASSIKTGDVVLLYGTLGMGKSVFARALIRALMNDPALEVPSPTFTLVQTYETPQFPLYHYDLYRIEDSEEIFELGWEEACAEGVALVEWPDRLGPFTPPSALAVFIESVDGALDSRKITIEDQRRCGTCK